MLVRIFEPKDPGQGAHVVEILPAAIDDEEGKQD